MMSRSHRHAPVGFLIGAKSEKQDKVLAHRAFRRVLRQAVHCEEWDVLPHEWKWADPYKWAKDGCLMAVWDGDWSMVQNPWRFWGK